MDINNSSRILDRMPLWLILSSFFFLAGEAVSINSEKVAKCQNTFACMAKVSSYIQRSRVTEADGGGLIVLVRLPF